MRNDRDYQNRNYNDYNRDRERNDGFRNYRSLAPGYGTDSHDRDRGHDYDSRFLNRAQKHDWDYDRSLGNEMDYDRSDARYSRGLRNEQRYNQSNREQDYRAGRNYESSYGSARDFNRGDRDFIEGRHHIDRDDYRSEQDFSRSNGGDIDRGRMYGRYNHEQRNQDFYSGSRGRDRDFNEDRISNNSGYERNRNSQYGTSGTEQRLDPERDRYYKQGYSGRTADRYENQGWGSDSYRRSHNWD